MAKEYGATVNINIAVFSEDGDTRALDFVDKDSFAITIKSQSQGDAVKEIKELLQELREKCPVIQTYQESSPSTPT